MPLVDKGRSYPVYFEIGQLPPVWKLQCWLSQFCRPEAVA
jgi:hypothetical protein